jgi:hypothetical protein
MLNLQILIKIEKKIYLIYSYIYLYTSYRSKLIAACFLFIRTNNTMNINIGNCANEKQNLSFEFDILSDEKTILTFLNLYACPITSEGTLFDEDNGALHESIQKLFKNVVENELWKQQYINNEYFTHASLLIFRLHKNPEI